MSQLMPHCHVAVIHGGFNTTITALSHGVPLVVIPFAADQPETARRCAEVGVGVVLQPVAFDAADVRTAVEQVRGTPSFRERAREMKREIVALPDNAAALVRMLAARRVPLTA